MFVVLLVPLLVSQTAERIKHEIGTAYIQEGDEILEMEVHGHNLAEGAPRSFKLNFS